MRKKLKLFICIELVLILIFSAYLVHAEAKESGKSVSEVLSKSTTTTKRRENIKKKSRKTYKRKNILSKKTIKIKSLNRSYYVNLESRTTTTTSSYEQFYKGKRYKDIVIKKTTVKENVTFSTGKSGLSPTIKKIIGPDLSKAFSKTGFKVDYRPGYTESSLSTKKKKIQCFSDESLVHEIGHFLALINDQKCYTPEFIKIYEEEKSSYFGKDKGTALQSSGEYFACCYQQYLSNPSELKAKMPKSYQVIEDCLNAVDSELIKNLK
ncbi:MAG: hypothetical protein HFJ43_06005 [Clostridia bacterium]|nr:hypothetical protein [Clostridia bacterium]